MEPSAPSALRRKRPAPRCAPAAATTLRPTRNDLHALADDARLPSAAVAKSLPAMAHRNLLGSACRPDWICGLLAVYLARTGKPHALSAMGGPDAVGTGLDGPSFYVAGV